MVGALMSLEMPSIGLNKKPELVFLKNGCENYFASMAITCLTLDTSIRPVLTNPRLRLFDFFVRMWLWNACLRLILPVPVSAKRFLAPELLFILGMIQKILIDKI
jgi:hypothetical protein